MCIPYPADIETAYPGTRIARSTRIANTTNSTIPGTVSNIKTTCPSTRIARGARIANIANFATGHQRVFSDIETAYPGTRITSCARSANTDVVATVPIGRLRRQKAIGHTSRVQKNQALRQNKVCFRSGYNRGAMRQKGAKGGLR